MKPDVLRPLLRRSLVALLAAFLPLSARAGLVLSGGGLALVEEGGSIAPGNLATSGTAFAKDLLPGYPGTHEIAHLNDQLFGNGKSWIGNTSGTFAGLSFGATPVTIFSIAFGRDNNGGFTDRTLGLYTLQYTTEPNPTNATTAWTTIGTLDYGAAGGTNYAFPSKRHRYAFTPVAATGIRLLVPGGGISNGTCIDELEAYSGIVVTTTADELDATSSAGTGVSLREAVRDAGLAPGADTITFAPALSGQTITLASEISINETAAVALDASSLPGGITLSGNNGTRLFTVGATNTLTLTGVTLTGGNGTGAGFSGAGGAILNLGNLTLTRCTLRNNTSATTGGAISSVSFGNPATLTLTNCAFTANASDKGGAIYIGSSSLTLTNCSLQGNRASSEGGGIYNFSSSPALNNSILWRNKDNSGTGTANSAVFNSSSTPAYAHCLIQGLNPAGTGNLDGTLPANNPLFVREADPDLAPATTGGDLRLRSASPAIDAGNNALNPTATDLGGRPRLIDGNQDNTATIDLGAHEWRRVFVNVAVAGGTQDGTSWANAFPHLQSALAAARTGDEIWVATGTYYPDLGTGQTDNARSSTFALKAGVALYGGFAGTETALSQRNPAATPTTLSGDLLQNDGANFANNADNAYHVLTATGAAITATTLLDGFTITAGNANGAFNETTRYESGGGFFCSSSASPTVNRCSFVGSYALNNGGGIFNNGSSPTLTNCSFQGNRAPSGGGILNNSSSPTLANCSFQGNSATSNGGGIYNVTSSPTLTNCSFQGNSAGGGGGIYNVTSSPTLTNCSFQGNSAGSGGGIFNFSSSSPTLTDCSFQGNSATSNGGGIFNSFSSATLNNCSFQGNNASNGGGIFNISSSPALNNCILWRNKDNSGTGTANSSVVNSVSTPAYSHCLIQGLNPGGTGNLNGTLSSNNPLFVLEVDPNLAPVTGGDLRLRSVSPAIDAGDNAANPTTTDLGGKPRLIDGNQDGIATIDLGAHEWRRVFVNVAVAGGNQDGTSWANAFPHLQSALAAAQAGDEIWVATGTCYPDLGTGQTDDARESTFALKAGVALYGGFAGTETTLSQRNPAATPTTLSGDLLQNDGPEFANNADNAYHVLTATGATITATTLLDGFTITAGNANGAFNETTRYESGGGLFCSASASPTINRCTFVGNDALAGGGGVFNSSASPTLTQCSFQGNRASGGGGISNIISSSPTLTHCSFQGNRATSTGGGLLNNSSSPTLTHCSFEGNRATVNGGGITNTNSSPTLNNCSFEGNSAGARGGGILNASSSPTLTNCSFQGNSASIAGGAIQNFSSSSPALHNCIIWNNKAATSTTNESSSVSDSNSNPTYSHCLIQGYSKATLDNGVAPRNNLEPANPLFVREVDPNLAPVTGGDLRLLTGSPALDAGDNAANTSSTDLAGNPRVQGGTIDLGAYEGNVDATFALLYPGLSPTADANGNGIPNFGDYAAGGNPSAPDDPTLRPQLAGNQLTFSFRNNAADLTREFQKSTTLLSGSWQQLIENTDYTVTTTVSSGGRSLQTLTLTNALRSSNSKLFFRAAFEAVP